MKIRVEDRNNKPATLRECRAAISRDNMRKSRDWDSVSYSLYLNQGKNYKFVRIIVDDLFNVNPAKLVDRWISKFGPDALISEVSKSIGAKGKESKKDTSEVEGSQQTGDQSHGGQHASKEVENSQNAAQDGTQSKGQSGGLLLHSIGASISRKKNEIRVWRTEYADHIPGAPSEDTMMVELSIMGYAYDTAQKNWIKKASFSIEEDRGNIIEFLNTHDRKAWPKDIGFARCWECGTYQPKNRLRWDGNGFYCGC